MNIIFRFCLILPVTMVKSQGEHIDMLESEKNSPGYRPSSSDVSIEIESPKPLEYEFYTDGTIRKYFAMDAALLDTKTNMLCSPIAATLPLGKLAYGSTGSTRDELLTATGIRSKHEIGEVFRKILQNLRYLAGVNFYIASRIYVRDDVSILPEFRHRCGKTFRSDVKKIYFKERSYASRTINQWVSENTDGKISNVISPDMLGADTSMVIVNAIYFKGEWNNPFNKAISRDFTTPYGVKRIPMMSRNGGYDYGKCDYLQAELLEIPYKGKSAYMIIVLPYSSSGLPRLLQLLKKYSMSLLNGALKKLSWKDLVLVTIPKFRMTQELDLNAMYRKVGVQRIFESKRREINKIAKKHCLRVSEASQVAYLDINESGSSVSEAHYDQPIDKELKQTVFNANRPFLFFIQGDGEQLIAGTFNGLGTR